MELSGSKWIELLTRDYAAGEEKVIIIVGKLTRTLKIKKDDWQKYFSNIGGIELKQGKEIEIAPKSDGGPKADVPDWARERLSSGSTDAICITRRDGKYYLKKLELVEQPANIPACAIIDNFNGDCVQRNYWNRTNLGEITYELISDLLPSMPKLKYDPIAPFKNMGGRLGLLGRKEFLGGYTKADEAIIGKYKKEICHDQEADGSWEQSAVHTAFKLIRLLEVDATMDEPPVKKAVNWLLNAKEPMGMPGMFMFSEKTAESFSAWKARQEPGSRKRGSRNPTPAQRKFFIDNQDVYGVSNTYCELKLTWATGIVLEALLRLGLYEEPRVTKALNTLIAIGGGDGWCGCGYFVANIDIPKSTAPANFNAKSIHIRGRDVGSIGVERNDILKIVCRYDYAGLAYDDGKTLVTQLGREGSGDCSMSIHRALAFHPNYHGSNLETLAALEYSRRQGWLGDWTNNYTSYFFSLLSRLKHPLAPYLVLRTVPLLVRQQRPDGFWQEEEIPRLKYDNDPKKPVTSIPTKEESTFMILSALKAFGFLDTLLPA